ncbi:MAG: hypothetical protein ABFC98_06335 [Candidatus Cloacimonas sp.]
MSFSERYGYEPKKALQFESMDDDLKMTIHNVLVEFEKSIEDEDEDEDDIDSLYIKIWCGFYVQDINVYYNSNYDYIRKLCYEKYNTLPWYRVYDFLEFYLNNVELSELTSMFGNNKTELIKVLNTVFEIYNSAYRFVDNKIIPITNQQEIDAIEEAANTGKKAIDYHLKRAIEIFANKKHRDYVNTVKEAISAVEATVNIINGTKGTTLSVALKALNEAMKALDEKKKIHPALCDAFIIIYGYTSDERTGIRHCIFDGTDCIPDFTDAKYMLVACSAFINYLLSKAKL